MGVTVRVVITEFGVIILLRQNNNSRFRVHELSRFRYLASLTVLSKHSSS